MFMKTLIQEMNVMPSSLTVQVGFFLRFVVFSPVDMLQLGKQTLRIVGIIYLAIFFFKMLYMCICFI